MIDKLLNPKIIIGTISFVFIMVVLFMMLDGIQDSPLAENEQANKTIQETKESLSLLTNGYFLAGSIASAIALIGFFIWLYRRYN
ncbi:MAG TPA: hypothetical protein PLX15_02315 [Candidatus Woesearchaeota archaeon]|nr:hypothetical protein [Candidatus Woesearchaeota archaeon]